MELLCRENLFAAGVCTGIALDVIAFFLYCHNKDRVPENEKNPKGKKALKVLGVIIGSLAGIFLSFYIFQPLMRTEKGVERYFLSRVPIGTTWDETVDIIEEHGKWEIRFQEENYGVAVHKLTGHTKLGRAFHVEDENFDMIGSKSMMIDLGEITFPIYVVIYVLVAYDENDEMIYVEGGREVDSL